MPKHLLHKIVNRLIEKYKDVPRNVTNIAFFDGLQDLINHPTNDERYDEQTCRSGWKRGKAEAERLDNIRGTDIRKILAVDPDVLKWWNDI